MFLHLYDIGLVGIAVLCIVFCASLSHAQVTYDLAADWSDAQNPNGVWSLYAAPGKLFTTNQTDWRSDKTGQRAWADDVSPEFTHIPAWMKTISFPVWNQFVAPGTILVHGAESERTDTEFTSAVWKSPLSGMVQISGDVWLFKEQDRPMRWELRKNGVALSLGDLTRFDPYSKDNPFDFANGSGGPAALQVSVVPNDELELLVYRPAPSNYATFVAVNFRISTLVKPDVSGCIVFKGGVIADATVNLTQPGEPMQVTKTDGKGCYQFLKIASGKKFQVVIQSP